MTVSEFIFLALGLLLGLASGIALIEVLRARPPARSEVRVTVAQDAIPRRRPVTLSDDAFVAVGPEPARGGPADRREVDLPIAAVDGDRRTHVPSGAVDPGLRDPRSDRPASSPGSPAVAVQVVPDSAPVFRIEGVDAGPRSGPRAALVGMRVTPGEDPLMAELRASIVAAAAEADPATARVLPRTVVAVLEPESPVDSAPAEARTTSAGLGTAPATTARCAEERRVANERCELSTRARSRAEETAATLRLAQRSYDSHESAAADAATRGDPRAVRAAKDEAQRVFRSASRVAADADAVEGAARDWLHEINRINAEGREAVGVAARERAAAAAVAATLERLSLEADAARIGAETAEAACVAARATLAECDEREAAGLSTPVPPPVSPALDAGHPDTDEVLGSAIEAGAAPRIFRLLAGEPAAMASLVDALAAGDPEQAPQWEALVTHLVDAILADAIDASALDFPDDHPFWGPFGVAQSREIVKALGSLGYRFDGRGGWVDDRMPSQRDLSLALGYAGVDPMRVRRWPDEAGTRVLFDTVHVAADEYLAINAGDLTLGEMVTMLDRRADGLAELWNEWGTIRPLLLQDA